MRRIEKKSREDEKTRNKRSENENAMCTEEKVKRGDQRRREKK